MGSPAFRCVLCVLCARFTSLSFAIFAPFLRLFCPGSAFGLQVTGSSPAIPLEFSDFAKPQKSLLDEIEVAGSGTYPFACAAIALELGGYIITIRRSRPCVVHTVLLWPCGTGEM